MKISVCMVTYNHEKFITQAIESVMMQEANFDYELVIGEDCSTDKTRDICIEYKKKYPDRIRLLLHEKNLGMMQNFVQTFEACRGEYVALLDGDDYWTSPDKLQKQADFLDTHPDYAMCFTRALLFFEDNSHEPSYPPLIRNQKDTITIEDLLRANSIAACSVMFRNGLFGRFPDWFHSLKMGDWPLHIMNAQHGKVGYISEVMAHYRVHAKSFHSSESFLVHELRKLDFYRAMDEYLDSRYRPLIRESLSLLYREISKEYSNSGDKANAKHYALAAWDAARSLPVSARLRLRIRTTVTNEWRKRRNAIVRLLGQSRAQWLASWVNRLLESGQKARHD
jgi:glycosyltransferase involved in cell wall biosynthesis